MADDIGEANTDKARVQQMVINLLSNAIKFTDSGMVTVTAQKREKAEVRSEKENLATALAASPANGSRPTDGGSSVSDIVISVSDTGKGIRTEELPTIIR